MKRKVIKQGNGTLTITLPKKWTEKVGLTGEDEISLREAEDKLIIETESHKKTRAEVNLSGLTSARTLKWVIASLYKKGYSEIQLSYTDPKTPRIVRESLGSAITGFAIMEQSKKKMVLKSLTTDSQEEFEPSLRRAFLVTLSLAEGIQERLESKNTKGLIELCALEKTNNQFVNICERLLLTKGDDTPKTIMQYVLVWNVEKVCDTYRDICKHLEGKKVPAPIASVHKEVLTFVRGYYELLYQFSLTKLQHLIETEQKLSSKISKIKDAQLSFLLQTIVEKTLEFSGPLTNLHL